MPRIRPVWSESSLGAQISLLVLSRGGSDQPARVCSLIESSLRTVLLVKDPKRLLVDSKTWSECADAQADLGDLLYTQVIL